jgi:hypothetical protein
MKPVMMRAVACEWVLCALLPMAARAQRQQTDLANLQIEDLMNVDVTSASKKEQNLLQDVHQEYAGTVLTSNPSLVRRSAYARLTWRF